LNIMESKYRYLFSCIICLSSLFLHLFLAPSLMASGTPGQKQVQHSEYIPVTSVIEHFGFDYDFTPGTGVLKISHRRNSVIFILGRRQIYTENRTLWLSCAPVLKDGQVFIAGDGVDVITRHLLKKKIAWTYSDGSFSEGAPARAEGMLSKRERTLPKGRYEYDIQAIVIDPGHGGSDPGGVGFEGIKEKEIVLDVAQELKRELQKRFRGKDILITREKDDYISLEERGNAANDIDPDKNPIFISIHANASFKKDTYGFETYFLSLEPASEEAREVALMENSVFSSEIDKYSGYLQEIMNRIVDVEYRRESMKLAEYIQKRLVGSVGNESIDRGVKSAFFYVLKASKMPSVLVEIGFVTNRGESHRLTKQEYQRKIARGIADGIEDFIDLFRRTEGFTNSY